MEKRKVTKFEKWLHNKNLMKLISLLMAIILWFYVAVTQDPIRSNRIEKVKITTTTAQEQLPDGLELISWSPKYVEFEATGKRSLVTGAGDSYSAALDLSNITAPIENGTAPLNIDCPDGVSISKLYPSTVKVHVDKKVTKAVPVKITVVDSNTTNIFFLDSVNYDETEVDVTLYSLDLNKVDHVGFRIDVADMESSTVETRDLQLFDKDGEILDFSNVQLSKSQINVDIGIVQKKTVAVDPDIKNADYFAEGFNVAVSPKTIDLYGKKEDLLSVTSVTTAPIVLNQPVSDGQKFTAKLELPVGTRLKVTKSTEEEDPSVGTVEIEFKK